MFAPYTLTCPTCTLLLVLPSLMPATVTHLTLLVYSLDVFFRDSHCAKRSSLVVAVKHDVPCSHGAQKHHVHVTCRISHTHNRNVHVWFKLMCVCMYFSNEPDRPIFDAHKNVHQLLLHTRPYVMLLLLVFDLAEVERVVILVRLSPLPR